MRCVADDDWRLDGGEEEYLTGATLVWKPYRVWSETWEHDHCVFCWTKFMDPNFSPAHREAVKNDSGILTSGFAAQGTGPDGEDDYHWVCEPCLSDLLSRF